MTCLPANDPFSDYEIEMTAASLCCPTGCRACYDMMGSEEPCRAWTFEPKALVLLYARAGERRMDAD